jgi:hypothetical protein
MEELSVSQTFNINAIVEVAETRSKLVEVPGEFPKATDQLKRSAFKFNNTSYGSDIAKNITVKLKKPSEVRTICVVIEDKIIERMHPDDAERRTFKSKLFVTNGIVLNPALFSISFIAEPVLESQEFTLSYYCINVDPPTKDYLKYNQYYSVHLTGPGTEKTEKFLAIYYCPAERPSYNIKFIDVGDVAEFNSSIHLDYKWRPPIIWKRKEDSKKEKHRVITVEVSPETDVVLSEDKLLKYETASIQLNNGQVSRSYVAHIDEQLDIESHLLSEYGLVSYVSIFQLPVNEIDTELSKKIFANNKFVLDKLNNTHAT